MCAHILHNIHRMTQRKDQKETSKLLTEKDVTLNTMVIKNTY